MARSLKEIQKYVFSTPRGGSVELTVADVGVLLASEYITKPDTKTLEHVWSLYHTGKGSVYSRKIVPVSEKEEVAA